MITEEFLGGQNSIAYSASDLVLTNVTLNGSQNLVKVYKPSNLLYIFFDFTLGTIESNGWYNLIEFPEIVDVPYYSPLVFTYPTLAGGCTNRLGRILPSASTSNFGFYCYTSDSNKRFEFGFTCMAR